MTYRDEWHDLPQGDYTPPPAQPAGSPPPPATTPTSSSLTPDQQSAKALITGTLGLYGLGALGDRAWSMYLSGMPVEQVFLELRQTPEYQNRFPGMAALSAKGRAVTEGEYIQIEKQYVALFREAGLPVNMYDHHIDFARFISNEVSPQEMQGRLQQWKTVAYDTPPEVRAELGRLYNIDIGGVMAMLMDPTRALPLIERQVMAATDAAAAQRTGFGALTLNEAESLAMQGVNADQAQQGFSQLAGSRELFAPILGDAGEQTVTRGEQLGAAFGGDAAAARKIEAQASRRKAVFDEGGSYRGFGSANT